MHGRTLAFGETYQVDLPVWGKSSVTIPTAKMAKDATESASASLVANGPKISASMARGVSDQLPTLVDKSIIEVEKRLSAWSEDRRREVNRGLVVTGVAAVLTFVGCFFLNRK